MNLLQCTYKFYLIILLKRIFESSLSFAGKTTHTEKWFGTDYFVDDISEDDIKAWENAPLLPELHLPKPNPFIPTNFDVVGTKSEIPVCFHPLPPQPFFFYNLKIN